MAPTTAKSTKAIAAKKLRAGAITKKNTTTTTTTITTITTTSRTGFKIRFPTWAWKAATAHPAPNNSPTGKTGIKIWLPKVGKQPVRRKLWEAATAPATTDAVGPAATTDTNNRSSTVSITSGTEIGFRMYLATRRGQASCGSVIKKPPPQSA